MFFQQLKRAHEDYLGVQPNGEVNTNILIAKISKIIRITAKIFYNFHLCFSSNLVIIVFVIYQFFPFPNINCHYFYNCVFTTLKVSFVLGAVAAAASVTVMIPMDTIKTRLVIQVNIFVS